MASHLELSAAQKIVLSDFYSKPSTKVTLNTAERRKIWDEFKSHREIEKFRYLEEAVPAIFAEISKALFNEKNVNRQYLASAYTPRHLPIYLIFQFLKIILTAKGLNSILAILISLMQKI